MQNSNLQSGDIQNWIKQDIQTGLPWINSEVSEQVLPQEICLDQIGGLSYNKGCYPGQEIIARLHYRGELKKTLYCGIMEPDTKKIPAGTSIYTENRSRKAGLVINCANDENKQLILAVLDSGLAQSRTFCLEDGQSVQIRFVAPGNASDSHIDDFGQD